VSGCSDDVGSFGYGDATDASWGMYGWSVADTGYGMYGRSDDDQGFGVRAHNTNALGTGLNASGNGGTGYFFTNGCGTAGTSSNIGAAGFGDGLGSFGMYGYNLSDGIAIFGRTTDPTATANVGIGNGGTSYVTLLVGSGCAFTGDTIGVVGYSFGNPPGGSAAGGYFDNYYGTMYAYVATEFGVGYKINGAGLVATIMETRAGKKNLFAPESPEPWFEDIGEGQLRNGSSGKIELDPYFLDCITVDDEHPLKVFVQLLGDCNGVYVKRYDDGFEVVELNDGTSNAEFCYRVIGAWKGCEDVRFPDAPPRLARKVTSTERDQIAKASVSKENKLKTGRKTGGISAAAANK
jgi:hypothetical protein